MDRCVDLDLDPCLDLDLDMRVMATMAFIQPGLDGGSHVRGGVPVACRWTGRQLLDVLDVLIFSGCGSC